MPFIGILIGGDDFSSLVLQVGNAAIAYGKFIQTIVNFLIIAWVVFMIVREDILLLRETRDLLRQRQG